MTEYLEGDEAYNNAPVGTRVLPIYGGTSALVKTGPNEWQAGDHGTVYGSMYLRREVEYIPDPYAVGMTIKGVEMYKNAPAGTRVAGSRSSYRKLEDGWWLNETREEHYRSLSGARTVLAPYDPYAVGEVIGGEKAYLDAPTGTRVQLLGDEPMRKLENGKWLNELTNSEYSFLNGSRVVLKPYAGPVVRTGDTLARTYSYNTKSGTVFRSAPNHRDFGRVVHTNSGRYLAVPNRAPRDFATEQEAIEWLL